MENPKILTNFDNMEQTFIRKNTYAEQKNKHIEQKYNDEVQLMKFFQ